MIADFLVFLIRIYQRTLSPLLGNVCRFEPSCSRYAVACLERHGAARGVLLSTVRVFKCTPFHPGGYDPPPQLRGRGPSGPQVAGPDAAPRAQMTPDQRD